MNRASSILQNAFSSNKHKRSLFAKSVAELVTLSSPEWVRKQLIPFLSNWINPSNTFIVDTIASQIVYIGIRAEGIAYAYPIIAVLILSGSKEAKKSLADGINKFKEDGTGKSLVSEMISSEYDDIRGFVPKIIGIVESRTERLKMLKTLISDSSFYVRMSVLKEIPSMEEETAKTLIVDFFNDKDDKIRSFIPAATIRFEFFPSLILPRLIADNTSWRVKAALADKLPMCLSTNTAVKALIDLFKYPLWEVKLISIRSFTTILRNSSSTFKEVKAALDELMKLFSSTQQCAMKRAIVDAFIIIMKKQKSVVDELKFNEYIDKVNDDIILRVRLYFFSKCAEERCETCKERIKNGFLYVYERMVNDRKWKMRYESSKDMISFRNYFNDKEVNEIINEAAFNLITDKVQVNRETAADYLSEIALNGMKEDVMEKINKMKTSKSFRKRQSAILTLAKIIEKSSQNQKDEYMKIIRELENDKFSVVSEYTKSFLNSQ